MCEKEVRPFELPANEKNAEVISATENLIHPCLITDLPEEVLLYVFSCLDTLTIWTKIRHVCRHWKDVAEVSSLWREICVYERESCVKNSLMSLIAVKGENIRSIKLQGCSDISCTLEQISQHCPLLTHLRLSFIYLDSSTFINKVFSSCPNIVSLNLEGTRVNRSNEDLFMPMFKLLPLKCLNLSHCHWVSNSLFYTLLINENCQLEILNIDGNTQVNNRAHIDFLIRKGHYLKSLFLDGENLTDDCFLLLSMCSDLVELSISFADNLSCTAIEKIVENKNLKKLRIRKAVSLRPEQMMKSFTKMKCVSLISLNFSECDYMTDEVIGLIVSKLKLLEKLSLDWCLGISDEGFEHIKKNCSHLRFLSTAGLVRLNSKSLNDIHHLLPWLTFLNLTSCNRIPDKCIENLTKSMPLLSVLNYFGENFGAISQNTISIC